MNILESLYPERYTRHVKYSREAIGAEYISISIEEFWVPLPFPMHPVWNRIQQNFNLETFLYPCLPVDIGKFIIPEKDTPITRVLRCPIKRKGDKSIILPTELTSLLPLIRHACGTEINANPKWKEYFAHITFERTLVIAGTSQRVPGWHVDGFQGVRGGQHLPEHSYLWSDYSATEWCVQPFFIHHLDTSRHDVAAEMDKQAKEINAYRGLDNHMYLCDPYMVHRSPVIKNDTQRCFFRLTFTETELEDPNNTLNLSLAGVGNYQPRVEVRDRLYEYKGNIPWEWYGAEPLKFNNELP